MRIKLFSLFLVILFLAVSCASQSNLVLVYLDNAELQYEGEGQRANIAKALDDMLKLPVNELRAQRYCDYSGKADQWDLETLILRHFVPARAGLSLGSNFYHDVKTKEVQEKIQAILRYL